MVDDLYVDLTLLMEHVAQLAQESPGQSASIILHTNYIIRLMDK